MNWRIIPYQAGGPAWNMAVDEAIFIGYLRTESPPTLRFYGWNPPTLSLGYFQDFEREVNYPALQNLRYGLVRRNTGGRAVLHHQELTYSVIGGSRSGLPAGLIPSYLFISKALSRALGHFGVDAAIHQSLREFPECPNSVNSGKIGSPHVSAACFETPSLYELTVDRRKIVGSAQYRREDSFLQHGSILLDFDPVVLSEILRFSENSGEVAVSRLTNKVTSLKHLGIQVTPEEMAASVVRGFGQLYDISFEQGSLTSFETRLADRLMNEKYRTDEWNFERGTTQKYGRIWAD